MQLLPHQFSPGWFLTPFSISTDSLEGVQQHACIEETI